MPGFRGAPQIEKSSPRGTLLVISKFIKRIHKEMTCFRGVAQIDKSSPRDATTGNAQCHKEK